MKEMFQFMSESPWLTFFLALIVVQGLVYGIRYIAIAFRGWPPPKTSDEDDD